MTIYTSLIGGLGNQMFQYAVGRALALRRNTALRLDISAFAIHRAHQGFELKRVFAVPVEIADTSDIELMLGWQSRPIIRRIIARPAFAAIRRDALVVEPHFHYWPGIAKVPQDCCLVGYWQSERYFSDATTQIREDLTFQRPLENGNTEVSEQIQNVNSVSLHVRRGDYVSNQSTAAAHGTCSLDYYRAAIRHVAERVENPHFFVFSDDMAWVKNELELDFPCQYIEHNKGSESYNDMRLMSLCRHHIIANSSFSWWGAWLNPRSDKIVVAPQKWFVKENITTDLYPPAWIKL